MKVEPETFNGEFDIFSGRKRKNNSCHKFRSLLQKITNIPNG